MLKSNIIKKRIIPVFIFFILCVIIVVYLIMQKSNKQTISENNQNIENKLDNDIILYKENDADLAIDYSNIDNLVAESEVVALVKIKSEEGMNYNPIREEYVPVYTTGVMEIENVILNTSDVQLSEKQELEYVRLGGKIKYGEYLQGLRDVEKEKLQQDMLVKTQKTTQELANKLVRDMYIDDIEIENNKEYLVFLKYTKDYEKYNILGFEYGLREYDSNTKMIKNNVTKEFENMEQTAVKINELTK